jgi:predicted HAD superfamily hydrolase
LITLQSNPDLIPVQSLRTFDVFDTLLTRVWLRPTDIFLHVGAILKSGEVLPISAVEWAGARKEAEARVRRSQKGREITLDEIYDSLQSGLKLTDTERRLCQDLELACERLASRPILPMTSIVKSFLSANHKVAYISDFYISGDFVRELLVAAGLSLERADLTVSCDEGATKKSGTLYNVVAARYGISRDSIVHTGDHPISDIVMAKRAGVAVIPYLSGKTTHGELVLGSSQATATEGLASSLIGGAARRARLSSSNDRYSDTWSLATGVAGPLLFGYVFWLLHEAKNRSIGRLYFLARDGQILLTIANEINNAKGLGLDLRYLPASRSAWFLASNATGTAAERAAALIPDQAAVVGDILKRIDVSPHSVEEQLQAWGYADEADRLRSIQGHAELDRIKSMLSTPPLSELIASRSNEESLTTLEYFEENDLLDGTALAIVDIGWKGRLQRALAKLLRQRGDSTLPTGFYLGLRESPPAREVGDCLAYFSESDALSINPSLAEVFCSADHGTVITYKRSSDAVVRPLLAPPENRDTDIWNLGVFQSGVQSFARHMLDAMPVHPISSIEWCEMFRKSTLASMRRLVQFPSKSEAEVLGSHPHASNQFHSDTADLSPKLSVFRYLQALVNPRSISTLGHWQQGSIARSMLSPRIALRLWAYRLSMFGNLRRVLGIPGSGKK